MKQCSKCNQEKSLTDFYKRGNQCKVCHRSQVYDYKKTIVGKASTKKYNTKKIGIYEMIEDNVCLYVGKSTWLNMRISSHKSWIKNPLTSPKNQQSFYKTLNNYKNICINVVEECSIEALDEREQHYIDTKKPLYNVNSNENSRT